MIWPGRNFLAASQLNATDSLISVLLPRLCDINLIDRACLAMRLMSTDAYPLRWQPSGLSSGYCGLALTCGHLDRCFPRQNWDLVAHKYLQKAVVDSGSALQNISLFSGLAGIGFTANYLSQNGKRYSTLSSNVQKVLLPEVRKRCSHVMSINTGCDDIEFDIVSGLAGVGIFLLSHRDDFDSKECLNLIINALSNLILKDCEPPAWHTPAVNILDREKHKYPNGKIASGIAHGMPGILAFLSVCKISGVYTSYSNDAIKKGADWLILHIERDKFGIYWEPAIAIGVKAKSDGQLSWCYGTPGICRALWLSGIAANSMRFKSVAEEGITDVLKRLQSEQFITNPIFCHGLAGILQIAVRFANGNPVYIPLVQKLTSLLLQRFDPTSLLGFQDEGPRNLRVSRPGLLEGMAGILLSLLSVTTSCEPAWDSIFAIN